MSPAAWFENLVLIASGGGLGALLVALIKKPWTSVEQNVQRAIARKEKALGDADMLEAMASTFTDVTGGLREEITRLQGDATEMRERAIQFEVELRAALQRVEDLERIIEEKNTVIARQAADLERVRAERDLAQDRVTQQEGEIRQLKQLNESLSKK